MAGQESSQELSPFALCAACNAQFGDRRHGFACRWKIRQWCALCGSRRSLHREEPLLASRRPGSLFGVSCNHLVLFNGGPSFAAHLLGGCTWPNFALCNDILEQPNPRHPRMTLDPPVKLMPAPYEKAQACEGCASGLLNHVRQPVQPVSVCWSRSACTSTPLRTALHHVADLPA